MADKKGGAAEFFVRVIILFFIIIGILANLIMSGDSVTYRMVVQNQVDSWNKGYIEDIQMVEGGCPEGYTEFYAHHGGTKDLCTASGGKMQVSGRCNYGERKSKFIGASPKRITKFNGKSICFKRSGKTYHDLIRTRQEANRGTCSQFDHEVCNTEGSSNFQYCAPECPVTAVQY